jgi:acyl-CoA reductase-like NAD-dependent aldehyde dehydrogenase
LPPPVAAGDDRDAAAPAGFDALPPTPPKEVERIIRDLQSHASEWAALGMKARARLLRACIPTTLAVAEEAATAATDHKGSCGTGIGEEL